MEKQKIVFEAKARFEERLFNIIHQFEIETGLIISEINLDRKKVNSTDGKEVIVSEKSTIKVLL